MTHDISRRKLLITLGTVPLLSGCQNHDPTRVGRLSIGADTYYENGTWKTDLWVHHEYEQDSDFHDIAIRGFSETGEEVCKAGLGNSTGVTGLSKRFTIECESFPYMFVVTAEESPCTDGLTFEVVRWAGSEQQKRENNSNDELEYKEYERHCNEPLPPERLLPDDPETTTDESTDS